MKAVETNLEQLLDGTLQYIVPAFQHPYGWGSDRWHTFLTGLVDAFMHDNAHTIFLGALVVMELESTPTGLRKFLLVDGRQRLITVLALFSAIRDIVAEHDEEEADRISRQCLLNPEQLGNYTYKLLPMYSNRAAFFQALERRTNRTPPDFEAARFFHRSLKRYNGQLDLRKFYDFLMHNFKAVRIEVEKDENPYPIFKSLNMADGGSPQNRLDQFYHFGDDPRIMALIASGESDDLEFKESLTGLSSIDPPGNVERYGFHICRAIAGFLNGYSGGTLLIGVADDGSINGVNHEYPVVDRGKANWDGYLLHLHNMLRAKLAGQNAFRYYTITRHVLDDKDICRIDCEPAEHPVYLDKRLFVRSGNQTLEMFGPDLVAYVRERWPNEL